MFPRLAFRRTARASYRTPAELLAGPSRRGTMAFALVLAAVGGGLAINNLAGANPATTDTTDVAFVEIPAKQVMGNNSIAAGKSESAIVIGGATTVPSNATTVRLLVTVKGTKAGTIKLYPAGNPAGTSGDTLSWTAGGSATRTFAENVGMRNKVTVENGSLAAAVVTVKITGYSTQVTAGGINGSGGTAGQALVNNGSGGVVWGEPGRAYGVAFGGSIPSFPTNLASLTVPPGSYQVTFTGALQSNTASSIPHASCTGRSPNGTAFATAYGTVGGGHFQATVSFTRLISFPSGGDLRLQCSSGNGFVSLTQGSMVALRVGTAMGHVANVG